MSWQSAFLVIYTSRAYAMMPVRLSVGRTSRRGLLCVSGSWHAEQGRLLREDPGAEVGENVRVGVAVGVGPMEFKLNYTWYAA